MVRKMSLANKTPAAGHSGEEVTRVSAAVAACVPGAAPPPPVAPASTH